jgi:hypothetical protein
MRNEGLDTILLMNVLKHAENDARAISVLQRYLGMGGRIVVLVSALPVLYGSLDVSYGHYRRYERMDASCRVRRNPAEGTLC